MEDVRNKMATDINNKVKELETLIINAQNIGLKVTISNTPKCINGVDDNPLTVEITREIKYPSLH